MKIEIYISETDGTAHATMNGVTHGFPQVPQELRQNPSYPYNMWMECVKLLTALVLMECSTHAEEETPIRPELN